MGNTSEFYSAANGLKSFDQLFTEAANEQPDRVAFRLLEFDASENEQITYEQLRHQVDFVSSVLYSKFDVGDVAVLFYPTSIEFAIALLGCLASGVVAVPVNPPRDLTPVERDHWIANIVKDSNAKAILTTEILARIMSERFSGVYTFDPGNQIPTTGPSNFAPVADSQAIIDYALNSDGKREATRISHGDLVAKMQWMKARYRHGNQSMFVSCLPTSGGAGMQGNLLQAIYAKCSAVFVSPFMADRSAIRWLEAASDFNATTISAPYEVFESCIESELTLETKLQLDSVANAYADPGLIGTDVADKFVRRFASCGLTAEAIKPMPVMGKGIVSHAHGTFNDSLINS